MYLLLIKVLKEEYSNKYKGKNLTLLRALLLAYRNPNFRVLVLIRMITKGKNKFFCRKYRKKLLVKYGVDFSDKATVGERLNIEHYNGIVVGGGSIIGDDCLLYQQVTLGMKNGKYPRIGNNVKIFAGAKIIGDVKIGDNVQIGANSVVLKDVPENCIAVGAPARNIQR
jgi:serine O-acetyltransferase